MAPAEEQLLAELTLVLARGGRLSELVPRIHDALRSSFHGGYVGLLVAAERRGEFMLSGSSPALWPAGLILHDVASLVASVAAQEGSSQFFTAAELEEPWGPAFEQHDLREHAAVLLAVEDEPLGILHLARNGPAFSAASLPLLAALSAIISPAVAAERQRRAIEASGRRRQLVADLSSHLGAGEPLSVLFDRLAGPLSRAVDFDFISLSARPVGGAEVEIVRTLPELLPAGAPSPVTRDELQAILARGLALQYRPPHAPGKAAAALAAAGYRRVLATVLRDRDEAFGILGIGRTTEGRFSDEEEQFLAIVAAMLGQALANQHRLHRVELAAAQSRVLNEISLLLNGGESISRVFDRLPAILRGGTAVDYLRSAMLTASSGSP